MTRIGRASTAGILLLLTACTAGPPAKVTPTPSVASSSAPAGTSVIAARGRNVPPKYKAVERNGEILYCQTVAVVGTRFPQEYCLTEAQVEEVQRRSESIRRDMDRTKACTAMSACGG